MSTSDADRRTSQPGLWGRLTRGAQTLHVEPEWETFVGANWASRIMSEVVLDRYHAKQGRSIGRWTLTSADDRKLVVYLKRHFELPRWHGLLAALFPSSPWSPGLEEWEHLQWAHSHGIPVPRAMATGELLGPWGRLQSFLTVEELSGMLAFHEAIPLAFQRLSPSQFRSWKSGVIIEMARLVRELHRQRAFHRDLYLCHFYLRESDIEHPPEVWMNRVTMIDFHRLSRRRMAWQWWQAKDLGQLLYSTFEVPGITDHDRLLFWKHYCAGDWGSLRSPTNWVRKIAQIRARRNDRHNRKRQARIAR